MTDVVTAFAPTSAVLKVILAAALATLLHTFIAGSSFCFIAAAFLAASSKTPFTASTPVFIFLSLDVTGSSLLAISDAFPLSLSNAPVTFRTADKDFIFSFILSTAFPSAAIFLFLLANSSIF